MILPAGQAGAVATEVLNDPSMNRYELLVDGVSVGETDYQLRGDTIVFVHTEIDPAHREAGLGGELARGALNLVRACAATYMIVTGVVYNTLLRGVPLPQGTTVVWSNEVLHVVAPLFLLIDLIIGTRPPRLPWRAVLGILVFPVLWIVYTLVRGPLVTNPVTGASWWYPYPFLDPHVIGGYAGMVPYILGIAVGLAVFSTGVVYVGRRRNAGPSAAPEALSPVGQAQ